MDTSPSATAKDPAAAPDSAAGPNASDAAGRGGTSTTDNGVQVLGDQTFQAAAKLAAATPAVGLRLATPADADAVTAVFLASRAAAMPYLPRLHSDEDTAAWITHVVLPECRVWVAEQQPGGRIAGFAALTGTELEHLYLHPGALRQGIGTLLLAAVRQASPHELTLHVFQRNTAARAFYEKHGFELVDVNDGSRNEEHEPDATYRWAPGG